MHRKALCSLTRKDETSRARARDVSNKGRRVGRRGFLQFAAAAASSLVVPDWGQRVFPMFARTHSVTIHDELHGVVIRRVVPWHKAHELGVGLGGFVSARDFRALGWTIEDNGKSLPLPAASYSIGSTKYRLYAEGGRARFFASPSRTLAIPDIVFRTDGELGGRSEWTVRSEEYAGGIIIGDWSADGGMKVARTMFDPEMSKGVAAGSWDLQERRTGRMGSCLQDPVRVIADRRGHLITEGSPP